MDTRTGRFRWTEEGPLGIRVVGETLWVGVPTPSLWAGACRRVHRLMGLGHEVDRLPTACVAVPTWPAIRRALMGLRLLQADTVFEMMLHAVLGQQVSVAQANRLRLRIFADFPQPGWEGLRVPEPAEVLSAPHKVAAWPLTGIKRRAIMAAAEYCADAEALSRLSALDDKEAVNAISALPGFGRWSAEMVLMEALDRLDVWPAGDLGIREALREPDRDRPSETEVRLAVPEFAGMRSYLAHYLWRWRHLPDAFKGADGSHDAAMV